MDYAQSAPETAMHMRNSAKMYKLLYGPDIDDAAVKLLFDNGAKFNFDAKWGV